MDTITKDPCKGYALRLEAISEILDDINAEIETRTCYYILLDHITTQLGLDAIALYVRTTYSNIQNIARLGFHSSEKMRTVLNDSTSMAKKVMERGQILRYNPNMTNTASEAFIQFFKEEGFYDYLGVPVGEKGQILGVLELYSITPFNTTKDWQLHLKFIRSLAANTIRRKILMEERSKSATELEVAYSETLEAWVRALEIRDQYTAGHTQRVLEMTLRLASKVGIPDEMLVHITRGVLLHDIGKLAVSDTILRKTGPLDNKEWQAMREHPTFAYKLLKPIQYLRPALDIPYCHHERWDGSGYPQGLKGDDIPFPARIFSVVDVWDALTTDRPYRKAWSKQDAINYIESKSGKEFDPKIVDEFIEMVTLDLSSTQPIPVEITRNTNH
ncbi:MAG: HD domain-containing phosphohydrolase [Anaerolineales bacterium]